MAILYDAAAESLTRTTNLPTPAGSWTIMFWIRFNALTASTYFDGVWFHANGATNYIFMGAFGPTQHYEQTGSVITTGSGTPVIDTWYHFALTCSGGAAPLMYRDGVLVATASSAAPSFTADTLRFGNSFNAARSLNGRLAHIKVYDAALTVGEIQQEMLTVRPHRYANVNCWYPLWDTSDDEIDYSGLGRNGVIGGTPTTIDGPPVSYGSSPMWSSAGPIVLPPPYPVQVYPLSMAQRAS